MTTDERLTELERKYAELLLQHAALLAMLNENYPRWGRSHWRLGLRSLITRLPEQAHLVRAPVPPHRP